MTDDTIFALSSGFGKSGVAVFRLSGPRAIDVLRQLCKRRKIAPRRVYKSQVFDPRNGELIDEGIVFSFTAPASFTGEDMAEIQVHGSFAVIDKLTSVLSENGIRAAEPGEFTRRGFINGKLDLAQAEALADLIDSETNLQRQQALVQSGGALSGKANAWRQSLIDILASFEAAIDFPDEEDIPAEISNRALPVIKRLIDELEAYISDGAKARRIRNGISVVLLGPPNAGKSSLLNYLANSDVAIVSNIPGTTRDALEVRVELEGVPVTFVDTAGLRKQSDDQIEIEGMRRSLKKAEQAEIRLFMFDLASDEGWAIPASMDQREYDIVIGNKVDLATGNVPNDPEYMNFFSISLETLSGLDDLIAAISHNVMQLCGATDEPRLTRIRHVQAVENTVTALKQSLETASVQPELAAEDVRMAVRCLGTITGLVDVEEVLGEIFSSFCIGK